MAHARTISMTASAALIVLILGIGLSSDTLARAMVSEGLSKPDPAPTASIAYDTDQVAFDSVLAVFEDAGLEIPSFVAEFHTDADPCLGNWGLHVRTSDGVTTIHVCFTDERQMVFEMTRHRTLLHEVAHAWVDQNVPEDRIAQFMELRGVSEWDSGEWAQQGAEHAAEIMLWGLQDEFRISPLIPNASDAELAAAFELLTEAS